MSPLVGSGLWFGSRNTSHGLFFLSTSSASTPAITNKISFLTDSVLTGTNLSSGITTGGASAGNTLFGVILLSQNSTPVEINTYTYANDSVSSGNSLNETGDNFIATGNSTTGLFCGPGSNGGVGTTFLYNYSSNSFSSGTSLIDDQMQGQTTGNATLAVIAVGSTTQTVTNVYTYSSNTVSSGTSLTNNNASGAGAFGTSTVGYFQVLVATNTAGYDIYNYSSNSITTTTPTIVFYSFMGASCSNDSVGLISKGNSTSSMYSCKMSTNSFSSSNALTSATNNGGGSVSTNPGGF